MFKVRTYNQISVKGLERFSRQSYEVGSDISQPDAFLLRSQKLADVEVPPSLLAAARAGAGVNNVPIADYSQRGIVVEMNLFCPFYEDSLWKIAPMNLANPLKESWLNLPHDHPKPPRHFHDLSQRFHPL